jgi:hypothetical protein
MTPPQRISRFAEMTRVSEKLFESLPVQDRLRAWIGICVFGKVQPQPTVVGLQTVGIFKFENQYAGQCSKSEY